MILYKLGLTRWTGQHLSQTPQGQWLIRHNFKIIIASSRVQTQTVKYRPHFVYLSFNMQQHTFCLEPGKAKSLSLSELMFPILSPGNAIQWLWFIRDRGAKGLNMCLHPVVVAVGGQGTMPSSTAHLLNE